MILAMIALIVVLVVINVPMAFALTAGSLFYLMFSDISIITIFRSMLPYIIGLLLVDILLFLVPGICLFLPNLLLGV